MSVFPNETSRQWIDGTDLSLNEISIQYGVPKEEAASFRAMVRIYPQNSVLIREGELDKTLFLLRSGTVGIYRGADAEQRRIATVEAVNFVGEMSLLNDEPRSATVVAVSETALTYAISQPNLPMILGNPKWAEILVSRFSKDLNQANAERVAANHRILALEAENAHLKDELARSGAETDAWKGSTKALLDAVLLLQAAVRDFAVIGSKGWHTVEAARAALRALAQRYVPALRLSEQDADLKTIQACLSAIQKRESNPNIKAIVGELMQQIRER